MTFLNTSIYFAIFLVANIRCFTITNEDPVLPTQKLHNDDSILRMLPNQKTTIITCPSGTYLDKTSLTCQFQNVEQVLPASENATMPQSASDAHLNPDNCRSFILSGAAGDFIIDCPANLLFNEKSGNCDWPMEAGCCEYLEKNSSRIVQNNL